MSARRSSRACCRREISSKRSHGRSTFPPGTPSSCSPRSRWLSEAELGRLLGDLPDRPLLGAIDEKDRLRISLAGAQDKVGVLADGDRIGLSRGNPPTTDILKAPIPGVTEPIVNEAYCMMLARGVGLSVAQAEPRTADGNEYLLVHRYDREESAVPDGRLHQEDFCQALGLVPDVKYENEGGPNVADCAGLIHRHSGAPARDIIAFLDALLFNFLIGNNDAHSKNYSLLLDGPGAIRVAPLYDLLCIAAIEEASRNLAMRYGGEKRPRYLRRRHLSRLGDELGVRPALVERQAERIVESVRNASEDARLSLPAEFQDRPILERIAEVVGERSDRLRKALSESA